MIAIAFQAFLKNSSIQKAAFLHRSCYKRINNSPFTPYLGNEVGKSNYGAMKCCQGDKSLPRLQ